MLRSEEQYDNPGQTEESKVDEVQQVSLQTRFKISALAIQLDDLEIEYPFSKGVAERGFGAGKVRQGNGH